MSVCQCFVKSALTSQEPSSVAAYQYHLCFVIFCRVAGSSPLNRCSIEARRCSHSNSKPRCSCSSKPPLHSHHCSRYRLPDELPAQGNNPRGSFHALQKYENKALDTQFFKERFQKKFDRRPVAVGSLPANHSTAGSSSNTQRGAEKYAFEREAARYVFE